jgi:hypothetical protein
MEAETWPKRECYLFAPSLTAPFGSQRIRQGHLEVLPSDPKPVLIESRFVDKKQQNYAEFSNHYDRHLIRKLSQMVTKLSGLAAFPDTIMR